MKIILSAFGKLMSQSMDVPENTTPYWDMVLVQPLQVISDFSGEKISERPPFQTKCRFEWTGKFLDGSRYYVLADISKI